MNHAVVIDFETANGSPSSVCSVGIVIVRDGEVVDSFYSLIHPYPDYYAWFCQQVHGLGPDDTEGAPLFPDVWDQVEDRILAARCTLPITSRTDIPASFGMRHRAAVGISEESDAEVIVVSEETGGISYIREGAITPIESKNDLINLLMNVRRASGE